MWLWIIFRRNVSTPVYHSPIMLVCLSMGSLLCSGYASITEQSFLEIFNKLIASWAKFIVILMHMLRSV